MIATYAKLAVDLPDSPYRMWIDETLDEHLPLTETHRAEVIGGSLVLSPCEPFWHAHIVARIIAAATSTVFEVVAHTGLDLHQIQDAYIPDLVLMDRGHADELLQQDARYLHPADISAAIEIISRTSARHDRVQPAPADGADPAGKASGYARCGVPFYLVVDGDPKVGRAMLYSEPDPQRGTYLKLDSRPLGEPVQFPEPIGLTIPTEGWRTWS